MNKLLTDKKLDKEILSQNNSVSRTTDIVLHINQVFSNTWQLNLGGSCHLLIE